MRRAALLLLPLLSACPANFTEPWRVTEPRLLAARVEAGADPTRARPRLGESFTIRNFVALPGPLASPLERRYSMQLSLCLGLKLPTGDLGCVFARDLAPTVTAPRENEVVISGIGLDASTFGLSPDALGGLDPMLASTGLEGIDRVALFGVLCVDGRAERIPGRDVQSTPPSQLFRCVDNAGAPYPDQTTFTLSVLLDRGLPFDANRNPSFECDAAASESACSLGLAAPGEPLVPGPVVLVLPPGPDAAAPRTILPWAALPREAPLSWQGCAGDLRLPQVRAGSGVHEVRVRFDPSDRELHQYEIERNGAKVLREEREALLLSHAVSERGGRLDRHFSELEASDSDAEGEVSFEYVAPLPSAKPEDLIPQNGRLVRLYLTLRDQRGGVDFTTRELCLLPEE